MENDLKQHITQFIRNGNPILLADGICGFMGFFYQVAGQALVGLLSIPGAAFRRSKQAHDADKILHIKLILMPAFLRQDQRAAGMMIARLAVKILTSN